MGNSKVSRGPSGVLSSELREAPGVCLDQKSVASESRSISLIGAIGSIPATEGGADRSPQPIRPISTALTPTLKPASHATRTRPRHRSSSGRASPARLEYETPGPNDTCRTGLGNSVQLLAGYGVCHFPAPASCISPWSVAKKLAISPLAGSHF